MPGFKPNDGKQLGLQIWRIEKMDVEPVDPKTYGSFHSGDCYLVLHSYEKKGSIYQDLHFWLGSQSSQDERGTAAYKTVELDDRLNGKPVQHREVQGYESPMFLSYFPKGIAYLEGGIDTAFHHVDPSKYTSRLFHVKGKRNVRCQQVELKASSLNDGDVFILDAGLTIYQWNGSSANKYEKFKGLEIATKIKDSERGGKAQLITLDSGRGDELSASFWKELGGSRKDIQPASAAGDDDSIKADIAKLFRVSDASGSLVVEEVARGRLEKSMLDHNDVFILDTGTQLFVWIGKNATKQEREKGMQYGQQYLTDNNRPPSVPLTRIPGGGETPVFKSFFVKFDSEPMQTRRSSVGSSAGAPPKPKAIHTDALYQKQQQAQEKMLDTNGKVEIWRIENLQKVPVDPSLYGQFSSGDSYIILYSYKQGTKDAYIIYMWQGRKSSADEKGACALLTVQLDDSLGGEPVQVRVVEGKEPTHFLALFKGRMVVHQGGVASGFHNRGHTEEEERPIRLYHVRGTTPLNTRAVEVAPVATSLNSGDSFTLITPHTVYSWSGSGSNKDERSVARTVSERLANGKPIASIEEGVEPSEFWSSLGGEADYPSQSEGEEAADPRLFQCSSFGDGFTVEEVFNYSQDDLLQDSVFILDLVNEVFVWIGREARKEDRDLALQTALDYVQKAPDGRSPDTPVFKVLAGAEPPVFTCHFLGWDNQKATDFTDPYQKKLGLVNKASSSSSSSSSSAPVAAVPERVTSAGIGFADPNSQKYTIAQLKAGAPNVDPAKKELYLNDADFEAALGQKRDSFIKLPMWKQQDLKKKAGIF